MKLPGMGTGSSLGTGPDLSLAKKGEGITSRPEHLLERRIAPRVLGGTAHKIPMAHGAHIKALGMTGPRGIAGAMSPIPSGGLTGQ